MTEQDKEAIEIVRRAYQQDREVISPDIVWHVPGHSPVSGTYRGAKGYFEDMPQRMAPLDEWDFDVGDIMVNGDLVVVTVRVRGLRKGHRIDLAGVHLMRVVNGKVVEGWGFVDKQHVLDEFFA